ncbi:MAG: adenosylmethionine decarboxylase [Patescibacteria group bacterium]
MAHLLRCMMLDLYECNREKLLEVNFIEKHMRIAAEKTGATVIGCSFHTFEPWGVSGTVTISESHLAVHTWPEYDFAAISIETCGQNIDPKKAAYYLIIVFNSKRSTINEFKRGEFKSSSEKNLPHKIINSPFMQIPST